MRSSTLVYSIGAERRRVTTPSSEQLEEVLRNDWKGQYGEAVFSFDCADFQSQLIFFKYSISLCFVEYKSSDLECFSSIDTGVTGLGSFEDEDYSGADIFLPKRLFSGFSEYRKAVSYFAEKGERAPELNWVNYQCYSDIESGISPKFG